MGTAIPTDPGFEGQVSRAPRKNLLLAATIEAGTLSATVRIRNLSPGGAMLDGVALPNIGTRLVLRRSVIEMPATVVWQAAGRCGVQFEATTISVDEWVAGLLTPTFNGHKGQQRVDAIQRALRAGAALPPEPSPASPSAPGKEAIEARVAEEILYVQRLLDSLGEDLVEDPILLQRHARALQNLDRASQMLEHLGAILNAPDRAAAAGQVKMEDLRIRLMRPVQA
ncbi:PilZ domain-containing protein [Sphingomonas sp. S2-65]|uniref:PilZ domain-containing protein n=1 Tax=Sphingomonas sp. S2-65 TaxID=2903960 RepID=UPI001F33FE76|nr:PilZ domain-containing protein [Sphingomonas sp. S2-65]UYY58276.1 PilZ domain-containing protein [Sphingomonas sp. S2-65]